VEFAFRVDASRWIGAGHLSRCLSLADALKARGARCRFFCRQVPDALAAMIAANGHELERLRGRAEHADSAERDHGLGVRQEEDARQTAAAFAGRRADWLIVDHYALDAAWERALRASAAHIMVIDDLADRPHDCDVLLDQNLHADAHARYRNQVPEQCRLLLGPKYALLRQEFTQERERAATRSGPVHRILVSFGGADAANHTTLALEALTHVGLAEVQVDVVIGAEHPRADEIAALCKGQRFSLHVQTTRMAQLMAVADLSIGAGGSATWERCCVGLPALALAVADNQRRLVHEAALAGALYAPAVALEADSLARHARCLIENPLLRESMSQHGMRLVDGRGTERVLRALAVLAVRVRPAVAEDARHLFEWRNHPAIRRASRSSAPLEWAAHNLWLAGVLGDPTRVLLIGESAGEPVGVVRFDVSEEAAQVSIYTVPGHEQRGTGTEVLAAAEAWLSTHRPDVRHLHAEVLGENASSHRLFAAADYHYRSTLYAKRM
jgi:UDP-2,4-diacetamido-2,4,6-trideoxy-beta-L-altropyranose hydrolase